MVKWLPLILIGWAGYIWYADTNWTAAFSFQIVAWVGWFAIIWRRSLTW